MIEHTIHWARDEFETLFNTYPNAWNKYVEDSSYMDRITGNEKGEMIESITYLWKNVPVNFIDCINFAIGRFYERYSNSILQLLHSYPKDMETNSGIKFWSGGKRCPKPLNLEDNGLCFDYVKNCSLLVAEMFNIDSYDIDNLVIELINNYKHKKFIPSDDVKISVTEKEEKENNNYKNINISELPTIEDLKKFKVRALEFEKDDDTNHHIDFITCSSNLRATNYDIPILDRYETKIKAGKIIPAISTTTSMVSGLVSVEIIKYLVGKRKIEDFNNTFLNLALSLVAQSDPMPSINYEVKDLKLSVWDYYNLYDDLKISKLFEVLSDFYKVDVDTLSFDAKLLMSPMTNLKLRNERCNMCLSQLLSSFGIIMNKNIYEIQIGCLMEDEDYELPNLKFNYKIK